MPAFNTLFVDGFDTGLAIYRDDVPQDQQEGVIASAEAEGGSYLEGMNAGLDFASSLMASSLAE